MGLQRDRGQHRLPRNGRQTAPFRKGRATRRLLFLSSAIEGEVSRARQQTCPDEHARTARRGCRGRRQSSFGERFIAHGRRFKRRRRGGALIVRAVVYVGARKLEVSDLTLPTVEPLDLLLEIEACGVCGSDVASYIHGHYVIPGQVLGHEISGRVAAIGSSLSGVEVGQRVAVRPSRSCGICPYCLADTPYLCGESGARSLGYGVRGGYAVFVLIPEAVIGSDVVPVPEELPPDEVLWAEPLAVAVHAIRRAGASSASSLLVIGAGSVGLCLVAAATAAGAREIVVVEPRENRRAAAASLGASAFAPNDFDYAGTFPIIFDTSGSVSAISNAITRLSPGGKILPLLDYLGSPCKGLGVTSRSEAIPSQNQHERHDKRRWER